MRGAMLRPFKLHISRCLLYFSIFVWQSTSLSSSLFFSARTRLSPSFSLYPFCSSPSLPLCFLSWISLLTKTQCSSPWLVENGFKSAAVFFPLISSCLLVLLSSPLYHFPAPPPPPLLLFLLLYSFSCFPLLFRPLPCCPLLVLLFPPLSLFSCFLTSCLFSSLVSSPLESSPSSSFLSS